jgi:hypothetical protein
VKGHWANESDTVPKSRPTFRMIELVLKKLLAFGYVTNELLQDAALLGTAMETAFSGELLFKAELEIGRLKVELDWPPIERGLRTSIRETGIEGRPPG